MTRSNIPKNEIHSLLNDARELRFEGMNEADIAVQLALSPELLTDLDRRFGGMTNEQVQHLLHVEFALESLREENRRLQDQLAYADGVGRSR